MRDAGHLSTRQYARLIDEWADAVGLRRGEYGTHSLRRTKASMIYKATGNSRLATEEAARLLQLFGAEGAGCGCSPSPTSRASPRRIRFNEAGRTKPSAYYDPQAAQLVDRYSERKQAGVPVDPATDHSAIAIARPG